MFGIKHEVLKRALQDKVVADKISHAGTVLEVQIILVEWLKRRSQNGDTGT